jgi:hypothetical protein|tara:strand:- start:268 stop:1281 length:1014 start_codon:yes stop_codon:yes gene_type:complete
MQTSLSSFNSEFQKLISNLLWRQWSELGVSGYARSDDNRIIDPEALLLFSTVMARKDPRLFDEILDWLDCNASRISMQRLTRMQKDYALGEPTILAAIASRLSQRSEHLKWNSLTQKIDPSKEKAKDLFAGIPSPRMLDPHFLKWGWKRGPIEHRRLSHAPRPERPATFLFKLRSLFGRQSRAEIIVWLLSNDAGHPAEIARQTGYFKRSIQAALNELEESGHIRSVRVGREKHFAIRHHEWRFLLTWNATSETEPVFPRWLHWPSLLQTLRKTNDLLANPNLTTMSPSMQAIEAKRAVDFASLAKMGFASDLSHSPAPSGSDYLDTFLNQIRKLLD